MPNPNLHSILNNKVSKEALKTYQVDTQSLFFLKTGLLSLVLFSKFLSFQFSCHEFQTHFFQECFPKLFFAKLFFLFFSSTAKTKEGLLLFTQLLSCAFASWQFSLKIIFQKKMSNCQSIVKPESVNSQAVTDPNIFTSFSVPLSKQNIKTEIRQSLLTIFLSLLELCKGKVDSAAAQPAESDACVVKASSLVSSKIVLSVVNTSQ